MSLLVVANGIAPEEANHHSSARLVLTYVNYAEKITLGNLHVGLKSFQM